jgi:hypothetical protein
MRPKYKDKKFRAFILLIDDGRLNKIVVLTIIREAKKKELKNEKYCCAKDESFAYGIGVSDTGPGECAGGPGEERDTS